MAYVLLASPAAQRELDDLPEDIADGLRLVLHELAKQPHSKRFDIKLLRGGTPGIKSLRLRVGDYRVILQFDHAAKEIHIVRIGHRSTVYRGWPDWV